MRWQDRDSVTSRDESFFPIRRTSTPRRCGACRCSRRFPWRSASPDRTSGDVTMVDTHQPSAPDSAASAQRLATGVSRAHARRRITILDLLLLHCSSFPMSQVGLFVPAPRHLGRKGTSSTTPRGANSVGLSASASIASGRRFRTSEAGRAMSEQRITRPACGTKTYAADLPMYGTCRGCTLTLPDEQITMNCDTCRIVHRSLSDRRPSGTPSRHVRTSTRHDDDSGWSIPGRRLARPSTSSIHDPCSSATPHASADARQAGDAMHSR